MQVNTDAQPYDSINVTPMLDLAYVLLVVFILMTTASVQGLSISLPKPSNQPTTERHELAIVQVTPQGSLLFNGAPVSVAELEQQLQALKARDAEATVAIRGDPKAQYAAVMSVIDVCNKVAVNMGLVTARIGT
jgi:biopolymer transport protein ExbD